MAIQSPETPQQQMEGDTGTDPGNKNPWDLKAGGFKSAPGGPTPPALCWNTLGSPFCKSYLYSARERELWRGIRVMDVAVRAGNVALDLCSISILQQHQHAVMVVTEVE